MTGNLVINDEPSLIIRTNFFPSSSFPTQVLLRGDPRRHHDLPDLFHWRRHFWTRDRPVSGGNTQPRTRVKVLGEGLTSYSLWTQSGSVSGKPSVPHLGQDFWEGEPTNLLPVIMRPWLSGNVTG